MLLGACSVQKSGSKLNAAGNGQMGKEGQQQAQLAASATTPPLRIDYLTPVNAIKNPQIYIYKGKRRLYVISGNVLVRDYPIGLGFNPVGNKERQGDGRTPEGNFTVCVKNSMSRFIRSLGLNYPNTRDAQQALFAGLITPVQYKEILVASQTKTPPPWNTDLGGQIFIHAGGANRDWTDGCIALYSSDMKELFSIAKVGTPVYIRP